MDLTQKFWNHVATITGEHNIDDVFLQWAAQNNLTISDAQDTWKKVYAHVLDFFNQSRVATDIEVTPDGGVSIKNVGDSEASEIAPPLPMDGPPAGSEPVVPKPPDLNTPPSAENMGQPALKEVAPPNSITAL